MPDIKRLKKSVSGILQSCNKHGLINHIRRTKLPSKDALVSTINDIESILFPGYYGDGSVTTSNLEYYIGELANSIYEKLSKQIEMSIRHECIKIPDCEKSEGTCSRQGRKNAYEFLEYIPKLRELLKHDTEAAFQGDPAAKSVSEILLTYPAIKAISIQRAANFLWSKKIPFIPRMMTEYIHEKTGIDIHPAAKIGKGFFIDHGTGVVIGETTTIGNNVKLYQGVTLGALSIPHKLTKKDRSSKRHPTLEGNVTIYAGATILGGKTRIGKGSIVGGNVWLTTSIPPNTKVLFEAPNMICRNIRTNKIVKLRA